MPLRLPERDLTELLSVSPSPWDKLAEANIFMTGGSGLFGQWLLESLLRAVDQFNLATRVTLLTRNPRRFQGDKPWIAKHARVSLMEGNILGFKRTNENFTHFVHLATPSVKAQTENPLGAFDEVVNGLWGLLGMSALSKPESFLLVSSGSVYGRHHDGASPIEETCHEAPDPLSPGPSAYDEGKRAAEFLGGAYWRKVGIPVVIARCFSFIGPMLPLNGHYAAGNFIRDAIEGHEITVTGDGTQVRSFLYLADLAWWLWVILVNGIPGRAYNVGSDAPVTIGEFAQRVSDTTLPPVPVNILQNPKEGLLAQGQVPSVKRAKEELGLRTRISLTESICRTISWYKDRKILLNQ